MKRRDVLSVLGGLAATWPLAARAQLHDERRIGMLMAYAEGDGEGQALVATFREALAKAGWVEGRNIHIDLRWAPASANAEARLQFAKELIAARPQLIISHGTPNTATLQQNTRTIPLIFTNVSDPIGSGFAASFQRPGGNITGFITMEPTMGANG